MAVAVAAPALADDSSGGDKPSKPHDFTLQFENDIFYDTDRHYTNGVKVAWTAEPGAAPGIVERIADLMPFFPKGGAAGVSFAIGQNMYTPPDISVADPPRTERPYAGWLYGSIGLVSLNDDRLDQFEVTVGVVGPWSLAEQTQKFVHDVYGAQDPKGWDTQLHNEPGIILTYQHSRRALVSWDYAPVGLGADLTPHIGGAVGNILTYAHAGATLRVGWNMPDDFGPPRIQPSMPGSNFFRPTAALGFYVFAGVDGRAIARNIFLDGNTFGSSRSVDREPLVGDAQLGVALVWEYARLAYTHTLRTREFEGQREHDDFGAVTLTTRIWF